MFRIFLFSVTEDVGDVKEQIILIPENISRKKNISEKYQNQMRLKNWALETDFYRIKKLKKPRRIQLI